MKNPFAVDYDSGYRWWTFSYGRETPDNWGWLKFGPLSFAWGYLGYELWHVEMTILAKTWMRIR